MNSITIDGQQVEITPGSTVLEAATVAGIKIPTLCAHPDLTPTGACRLCVVQIKGQRGFPTACTTPVVDGMVVTTSSAEVIELRRNILKLLLSGHTSPCIVCLHKEKCQEYRPHPSKAGKTVSCAFCSNRNSCEMRDLAEEYGIDDLELPIAYKNIPLERLDPFMDRDYNLCVLCERCVRICKKLHGKASIDFIGRSTDVRVGTAFHRDHLDTDCQFCGACIDICPTGALADRFARWRGAVDWTEESTCILCPLGCSISLGIKDDRVAVSTATAFTREARVCAVGRFVLPQILENPNRLNRHRVRTAEGVKKVLYSEAVLAAAEHLSGLTGAQFALVAHPAATREEQYIMRKFTREVMQSYNVIMAAADGAPVALPAGVKAVFTTGNFVAMEAADGLEAIIVSDILPSPLTASADVVFGAAVLAEVDGTFLASSGQVRTLAAAARPPDDLHPDWKILCDLADAMGVDGFKFALSADIREEMEKKGMDETPPVAPDPSPLDDLSVLPRAYRGHRLSDIACALKSVLGEGEPDTAREPEAVVPETAEESEQGFKIVEKVEVVPNTHMVTIHAPLVAKSCQPGQFVIVLVNETSERIPYTIADFDREKGTVTVNVLEAGRSSREMALLETGDYLDHFVGPLGKSIEVKKYGTVVCGGGCYGVGSILPIARALKEAGNRVFCIEEASSSYLLHWQDKLSAVCDELIITTKDGSTGIKGGVQEGIGHLVERGETIDQAFIIGCTFMMMLVSEATKEYGIPTMAALNPIMLDGTGMCGACRVTVGGKTMFACVTGPFLDGHQIDWEELMRRRGAYAKEEVEALPQEPHRRRGGCTREEVNTKPQQPHRRCYEPEVRSAES